MAEIGALAQKLARAMKQAYGVKRVGFAFTGGDVPHAHAHVVPLHAHDDLTSRRYIAEEKVTYRDPPRPGREDMLETARLLRERL